MRIAARIAFVVLLAAVAIGVFAGGTVLVGMNVHARTSGTLDGTGVRQPVTIVRDNRDIPHIRARNEHDMFFAQGYVEGADRLFQMELLRRYVYGTLSEVLGKATLDADANAREIDIRAIVARQWDTLPESKRADLQAFSDGVNLAMQREPLPVEFRTLDYKPQLWSPQDSLAVGFSTVLDLIDKWDDVGRRSALLERTPAQLRPLLFSLTDPYVDAPTADGKPAAMPTLPPLPDRTGTEQTAMSFDDTPPIGSNNWAVGSARSTTGRALLANDPHLRLQIPEIWYLIDMQAPGYHAAGGSLAGTPGVILGHNDDLAWGATNGTVVTEVVYKRAGQSQKRTEVFHVRFGTDVTRQYERDAHGFVAGGYAVDWSSDARPQSAIDAFESLDRARNVRQAMDALRAYAGPPQNFVLADRSGAAAYALAGPIPNDPGWGLAVHEARDPHYPLIEPRALPHVDPSTHAAVFTANNRMYGSAYPLRLSAHFAAPYRAARIAQLLRAKPRLSPQDFSAMQADTFSIPEYAIARATLDAFAGARADKRTRTALALLRAWDGHFDGTSRGAPLAWRLRQELAGRFDRMLTGADADEYHTLADGADLSLLMRALHERPRLAYPGEWTGLLRDALHGTLRRDDPSLLSSDWAAYNRVPIRHPLAALGLRFLNGRTLPGDGDSYTLHVQTDGHSQSFRAVWDVGNWDGGGIAIPSGESGEPGSGHYTDLTDTWIANETVALPYSEAAVRAATVSTLVLAP